MKLKIETWQGQPSWYAHALAPSASEAVCVAWGRTEREAKRRLLKKLAALGNAVSNAWVDLGDELEGRRAKGVKR